MSRWERKNVLEDFVKGHHLLPFQPPASICPLPLHKQTRKIKGRSIIPEVGTPVKLAWTIKQVKGQKWITLTGRESDTWKYTHCIAVKPAPTSLTTTTISHNCAPLYRLITATYSSPSTGTGQSDKVYSYACDAGASCVHGNRLAMGADGELITYTYDHAIRLTWVDDVEYTWDDGDQRVAWQPAGRRRAYLRV